MTKFSLNGSDLCSNPCSCRQTAFWAQRSNGEKWDGWSGAEGQVVGLLTRQEVGGTRFVTTRQATFML